jgi:hypothetical protein
VPKTQAGVPPEQTVPHSPQLFASVRRFDSQPLARLVSQSRKPAAQLQRPERQALVSVLFKPPEGQLSPHALQFVTEVRKSVSQPSVASLLQLPKLASQVDTLHALPLQLLVATWGRSLQSLLQAPQFAVSLLRVVSQPSPVLELQSARPVMQTRLAQALLTQLALMTPGSVLQLLLQPLQLVGDDVMLTSQPSPVVLLQLAKPDVHALMPQFPPEQVLVALAREQTFPQAPQWLRLLVVFTQAPEQLVRPPEQVVTQEPLEHTWFIAHDMLQDDMFTGPQWVGLESVSMHVLPQRVCPLGQAQVPLLHTRPPVQMVPQAPQLAASVWVFTQVEPHAV